jgi:precorrin-6B methylase 2
MGFLPWITKLFEKIFANTLFPIPIYHFFYKQLLKDEIKLCSISCKDKVLCIGGGPIPCTAIEIAKETGACVEVIDNDSSVIKFAQKVIKLYGLEGQVKIVYGLGQTIDPKDYSVIHIARQTHPKRDVINNILKKASFGARILVRYCKNEMKNNEHTLMLIKGGKDNEKRVKVFNNNPLITYSCKAN